MKLFVFFAALFIASSAHATTSLSEINAARAAQEARSRKNFECTIIYATANNAAILRRETKFQLSSGKASEQDAVMKVLDVQLNVGILRPDGGYVSAADWLERDGYFLKDIICTEVAKTTQQ